MTEDSIDFLRQYDRERDLHNRFVAMFKEKADEDFGLAVELADDVWRSRCGMAAQSMPLPDLDDHRLNQLFERRRVRARQLKARKMRWDGREQSDDPREARRVARSSGS